MPSPLLPDNTKTPTNLSIVQECLSIVWWVTWQLQLRQTQIVGERRGGGAGGAPRDALNFKHTMWRLWFHGSKEYVPQSHLLCLPAKCIGCKRAGWKSLLMRYKCDATETSRVRSYQYAIIHFMGSEVTDSGEILSVGVAYWGKCLSDPALVNLHLWQNAFLTNECDHV